MKFTIPPAPARSPGRPAARAGVELIHNGYGVPGVAIVEAWPDRPLASARAIARRIYKHPGAYLAACAACRVPGVTDLRHNRDDCGSRHVA